MAECSAGIPVPRFVQRPSSRIGISAQVDNMVERLARQAPKTKVLRLGHPARLLPEVGHSPCGRSIIKSQHALSLVSGGCEWHVRSPQL